MLAARFIASSASHAGRNGKAGTLRGSEKLRQFILFGDRNLLNDLRKLRLVTSVAVKNSKMNKTNLQIQYVEGLDKEVLTKAFCYTVLIKISSSNAGAVARVSTTTDAVFTIPHVSVS